ncbi:MAG: 5'-3' exonuclease H3TH domain-containing protein, partial [Staphylococcus sp.]|nr:5'-3' exonuclease H3TH domain-containing protein [Staphylococcus sp.]
MTQRVLLVDGMALLFRHFYATSLHNQFMYNSKGMPTNGIQGFVRHIFTAIKDIKPSHVAICWDMGKATFRNAMYTSYKQNRPAPPEELIPQFDYVKDISEQFGFVNIGVANYEADDVIGTLAKIYSKDNEVHIVTGDRDLTQLATQNVTIYYTKKGVTDVDHYTPEFIAEKYNGLKPIQIIDMKGLMGDSSDNIPGVAGVGEKTAIKLLNQFDSVEGVYENIDKVSGKKLKEKLELSHEDALMSKELATINRHSPIEVTLSDTKLSDIKDNHEKIELFKKLEFKQLLADIDNEASEFEQEQKQVSFDILPTFEYVDFNHLDEAVIHFEIDGSNYLKDDILKFGFYDKERYIVVDADNIKDYPELIKWLENENSKKVVYDAKKTFVIAHRLNITIQNIVFDAMLASYIIDPSRTIDDVYSVVTNYHQTYVKEDVSIYGKGKKRQVPNAEILNTHIA